MEQKQVEKQKETNWLRRGIVAGLIAGSIFVLSNKKTRTKVTESVGDYARKTKQFVQVVQENRESFIQQLKYSGERISSVIDSASDDIQTLVDASKHLRDHSQVLLNTLKQTKGEFQSLTEKLKTVDDISPDDVLPESDEDQLLQ